jgi:hypothetical protein
MRIWHLSSKVIQAGDNREISMAGVTGTLTPIQLNPFGFLSWQRSPHLHDLFSVLPLEQGLKYPTMQ